jgi:hydrogenase maturation protease
LTLAEPAPTLVLAWGNPSRGDDALGPLFADAVQAWQLPGVQCLTDFQLQVEHALDLQGRRRVLFVDASMAPGFSPMGYALTPLQPRADASYTSHALSPQAVLHVWTRLYDRPAPPAWLLSMEGHTWGLGDAVSPLAQRALRQALAWAQHWLRG